MSLRRRWVPTDICILGKNVDKIENESQGIKMTCSPDWVPPIEQNLIKIETKLTCLWTGSLQLGK